MAIVFEARLGDRDRVEVLSAGRVVAVGRWDGIAIVECAPPAGEVPSRWASVLAALAARVEAEITAAWRALPPSCDEQGVDLTLIDWMLGLTPAQRLAVLQDAVDTFAGRIDDRQ